MTVKPQALPMAEAEKFWRDKDVLSSSAFYSLAETQRSRAFAVAGIAEMDMMRDVYESLGRAISEGKSFGSWKKEMAETWEKLGWTGKNAWRLDNIFRTNVQTAFAVGRHEQMQRVKQGRPYWRYSAVKDTRTRPTHWALHGKVFHADNPFWDQFYPPNGFRCRCGVTTLSERQVKKRGIEVETKNPYGGIIEPVDPVTGRKLPARPLMPDRGFETNPAKDYWAGVTPSEIDAKDIGPDLPLKTICRAGGASLFAEGDICRPPLAEIDKRHILPVGKGDILPTGLDDETYVKAFLNEFGIADIDGSKVIELPGKVPVVISKHFFIQNKKTGAGWKVQQEGREQYVRLLARTIQNPYEIWRVSKQISKRPADTLRLLRLFQNADGKIGGFAVFSLIRNRQWLATTAFNPKGENAEAMLKYLEKQREKATLIYREELK
ncbi:MAG: phage minor head protein [Thermodesulfobacteriota bacterium]|nr:phage minor head protein [Thermodesulfobacteriota bacterium]